MARAAITVLEKRNVDFEFDGEMTGDIALDYDLMKSRYPFCRLSGPANILVMPGLHSANIAFKLVDQLGSVSIIILSDQRKNQHFLHQTITEFREKGWTFNQTAHRQ